AAVGAVKFLRFSPFGAVRLVSVSAFSAVELLRFSGFDAIALSPLVIVLAIAPRIPPQRDVVGGPVGVGNIDLRDVIVDKVVQVDQARHVVIEDVAAFIGGFHQIQYGLPVVGITAVGLEMPLQDVDFACGQVIHAGQVVLILAVARRQQAIVFAV